MFLGIDTSCYTTSCALVGPGGELLQEERQLLSVKAGARGLQQSEMVFQHTRALPMLMERLNLENPNLEDLNLEGQNLEGYLDGGIQAIGVSAWPRREEDSYMPAFLVGHGVARSLAKLLKVPLYLFSHQENHIMAALRTIDQPLGQSFYSLHVSGGTTEVLVCDRTEDGFFTSRLVGGAMDLHGGQFVDRVGVALGLSFPAGPALEKLSAEAREEQALPVAVKGQDISFGGPCSEAMRRIEKGVNPAVLAKAVLSCIADSLIKVFKRLADTEGRKPIVAVGGVLSNAYIRQRFLEAMAAQGMAVYFADRPYSSDNSTGNAYGAYCRFTGKDIV